MGDFRDPNQSPDATGASPPGDGDATILPTTVVGGRLRIERVIGEGAFGRVYLAFDTRLRRNVAIKELLAARNKTDTEAYERYLDRFQREARVAGTIQHTNVVTVYDLHVESTGDYYLVMEYVDGVDLRALLAQVGTLPVERAVAIALDVAHALQAVHEQDVVHRDLKPANIMLTRRGTTKLTDFGIAQAGHESQRTHVAGTHPGTPLYMSPEQSSGYGYLDGRSDLYSLGLVMYEMLVGEPYARKRQPLSAARPDLSPQLVAIINRLMAPDVAARYQSAADVITDLQRLSVAPATGPALSDAYHLPDASRTGTADPAAPQWPPTQVGYGSGWPGAESVPGYGAVTPPITGERLPVVGAGQYPPVSGALPTFGGPAYIPTARGSRRWPLFALGGGVLAVALIGGIVLFTMRGGTTTATATTIANASVTATTGGATSVSGGTGGTIVTPATTTTRLATVVGTPVATVTLSPTLIPTPRPTATSSPIPTATNRPTAPPAATAAPFPGPTIKWTDPKGVVTFQYPSGWTPQTLDTSDPTGVLILKSPDGLFFYVDIYDPQQGSIAQEIQFARDNHAKNAKFTFTDGPVMDVTVGGEPAKMMSSSYVSKAIPNQTPGTEKAWAVNHVGREVFFDAQVIGNHGAEVAAMIGSVSFAAVWADPAGLVKLQYPLGWSVTTDTTDPRNVLELVSPDGVFFYLDIYDPQQGTLAEEIGFVQTNHAKSTQFTYTDTGVTDVRIGGEDGRSLSYSYTAKNNPTAISVGQAWTVNHGGKQFFFSGTIVPTRRAEIEFVIASIVFTK
ncbi:MAG: serine/threonine protein kinase [Thermomicrobiales bacterium]